MKSKLILAAFAALAITGAPAAQASLLNYNVEEIFFEPAYGGKQDTVFNGTFTYDSVAKTITNLKGTLSEAMTAGMNGGKQILLNLSFNPVASRSDGKGGIIASTFLLNTTSIYSDGAYDTAAMFKKAGIANAYATINVSADQLSGANQWLPASSFKNLFYGDCQPGGMMGPLCMTAFDPSINGGTPGSMGGYVLSERVWAATPAAVPLPPAAWTFLTSMIGLLFFGKQRKSI